ncbi:translation initiation factor IF-2 [Meles meles]|uniref:translation initiation factor IF-2 n=1 Tax=Meles meles TaxID=9662 RepID=UPI001E6A0BC5|nr:translation initiation factor IF-2 [Meles meles]
MGVTPSPRTDRGRALEIRRPAGERGRRGATPTREPAGKPGPQPGSAVARVARVVEAEKWPPRRREGRTLPVLGAGCGYGAAREGPGRGSAAGSPPGEEQGAEGEGRGRRTGSQAPRHPARRAGLDSAAPGVRGRWVSHSGGPVARRLRQRQREPAPGRSRSPSGWRRRRKRGGATGSVTRLPGSSCDRGGARCGTGKIPAWAADCGLFCGGLRAAPGAVLPLPCAATTSCRRRAGGRVAGCDSGGRRPGRPRGGPSDPAEDRRPGR